MHSQNRKLFSIFITKTIFQPRVCVCVFTSENSTACVLCLNVSNKIAPFSTLSRFHRLLSNSILPHVFMPTRSFAHWRFDSLCAGYSLARRALYQAAPLQSRRRDAQRKRCETLQARSRTRDVIGAPSVRGSPGQTTKKQSRRRKKKPPSSRHTNIAKTRRIIYNWWMKRSRKSSGSTHFFMYNFFRLFDWSKTNTT